MAPRALIVSLALIVSGGLIVSGCSTSQLPKSGEGGRDGSGGSQGGQGGSGGARGGSGGAAATFEPVFRTDFEPPGASGSPADAHKSLLVDNLGNPAAGKIPITSPTKLSLFYEGGEVGDRYARLSPDPTGADNTVLHYWLRNAVIPNPNHTGHTKGRVQVQINFAAAGYEQPRLYAKQRFYLHPDLGKMVDYPLSGDQRWLSITLQELWFGAKWEGHPLSARISVTLYPNRAAGTLHLATACDTTNAGFENFWSAPGSHFALPLGEWLTMEMGYQMGDKDSGRFVLVISADSLPAPVTIVDMHNVTYNPHSDEVGGLGPIPLSHWQPLKFYTSDNIAHFIRDQGGVAQIYWDDFELSDSWPPAWP